MISPYKNLWIQWGCSEVVIICQDNIDINHYIFPIINHQSSWLTTINLYINRYIYNHYITIII